MTRSTFRWQQIAGPGVPPKNGACQFPYLVQQPSHTHPLQFPTTGHWPPTTGHCPPATALGRSGRSGPPLCGGTPPATPPCSYATVRARPQLVCQRPGGNTTVRARCQPVANAPRTRCHRVRSPPLDPPSDRLPPSPPLPRHRPVATGYRPPATGYRPLATIHYPLPRRNPLPPSPARVSETCYNARSSPNTTRLDPTAPHHTTARPPCPGRKPCRPAPNRTSESCPKRTSLRALPVTARNAQTCRPPRRPHTVL